MGWAQERTPVLRSEDPRMRWRNFSHCIHHASVTLRSFHAGDGRHLACPSGMSPKEPPLRRPVDSWSCTHRGCDPTQIMPHMWLPGSVSFQCPKNCIRLWHIRLMSTPSSWDFSLEGRQLIYKQKNQTIMTDITVTGRWKKEITSMIEENE